MKNRAYQHRCHTTRYWKVVLSLDSREFWIVVGFDVCAFHVLKMVNFKIYMFMGYQEP